MKTVKKRVLGIEGGGTKTEWIYIEIDGGQQRVIEQGMLPAANFKLIPEGTLLSLFRTLPTDIAQVGAFLAGCGLDVDRVRLQSLVRKVWPNAHVVAGGDRESGFATAFRDRDG